MKSPGRIKKSIVAEECCICGKLTYDYMNHEGKNYCFKCWIDTRSLRNPNPTEEELWGQSLKGENNG